jgi:hypothetical protein
MRDIVIGKLVDRTIDDDYAELSERLFGEGNCFNSSEVRKRMYGMRAMIEAMERDGESVIQSEDILSSIDEKRIMLQKERVKIQTEKLEYAKWLREDARDEMFMEKVIDAIKSTDTDCSEIRPLPITRNNIEHGLFIADCHFGKEFKIYGLRDEVINEYSPEIFYERMELILSETLDYIAKNNVSTLKVLNLGDTLDGFIRHSQIWTLRYGVVDSAIIYGKYMGEWLKRLSHDVIVEYHPTSGNHTELRLLDGKKGEHLCDNMDGVVNELIKLKNEKNPNFSLVENKTGLIFTQVSGFNLLGVHGEVKNPSIAIKDFADIYDTKLDFITVGHKHHGYFVNCGYRKQVLGIGSIVGSDDFSMRLRKQADAAANIVAFEVGKGKVNDKTIVLN